MMNLWLIYALQLIHIVAKFPVQGEDGRAALVGEALNTALGAAPRPRDFVILFKEHDTLIDVGEVQTPWGIGLFQVTANRSTTPMTGDQLSSVGDIAQQLRQGSWSVTVVVVSDNLAFLNNFAEWCLSGHLLVWSTRLLVLTNLPLHHLLHLRHTLAMTNSMLLHLSDSPSVRMNIVVDLPYRMLRDQPMPIASWSPTKGLRKKSVTSYFPEKFTKFPNGARLKVSRVVSGVDKTQTVDDPATPGEKKIMVFNPENSLIETIAKEMNFSIQYIPPGDGHWGMLLPDGTWTGMIGMVHRQEADIALGLFTMTPSRFQVVDFTHPATIIFVSTFAARGIPEVDPWGFLLPFMPMVWVALLTALLGLITVMAVLFTFLPLNKHPWDMVQSYSANFIQVVLQQNLDESKDWWWWERVVMGVWMLMTLVLTKSYAGNLMSQLAVRYVPEPLQTLEDLVDSSVTVMINEGTSEEQAFRTAEGGIYQEIWNLKDRDRLKLLPGTAIPKVPGMVRRGSAYLNMVVYSMMAMAREFANSGLCEFYIGRGEYLASLASMAVAKGSSLNPAVSRRVMEVSEAGLYDYWHRMYHPNFTSCLNAPTKYAINSVLAITNIWGMFVLLAGGVVSSVIVFLLELLHFRFLH